jgi:dipeptidyl aminopeptidase/acylaminoacyl peptidase
MQFFLKTYIYLSLVMLLFGCKSGNKTSQIKAEVFFNDPQKSSFHISPDGKNLSFLQPYKGKLNIFVQSLEKNKVTQVTAYLGQSIKSYFWAGDQKIFYLKDIDGSYHNQLFSVNIDGTQINQIKTSPQTRIEVLDQVKKNNNFILIAMNERVPEYFDVYKLDIISGERTLFVKNPGNIIKWISDNEGKVTLAVGSDGVNETLYYRENENNEFKPIFTDNFKSSLDPVGFTEQKNHIYALSNVNRDKLALVDFDCSTGKEVKVIYENPDADISEVIYSKSSNKLAYLTYEISKREIYFLDDKIKAMYDDVRLQLPQREVKIIDRDQNESHFLIRTYTDKDPGAYYLYQIKDRKLIKLADLNTDIKVEEMCEMKPVTYKSRDGLLIHGYLTLPLGKKAKNLPCIVIPHSGPSTRNVWGYSPEVQFLASRGYAVFQMNFRGSTGYGKAFQIAGFKQWGNSIQNDITDGVKWLIGLKIIDPKRIGVYGYSFGGYAALNQAIYHPELYQCAASYSGFINLFTYIKGFPVYYKPYQQMLNEIIGNPELDVEYLKYASPIFQIEKIKTPLLIAQGGKDSRVNVSETNQFVKELKKRNLSVTYIVNDKEGHYFRDPINKLAFFQNLEAFLNKNLHPDK